MTDQYAYAQAQVDKVAREKIALINEMDEIKLQLRRYDKEASMVCTRVVPYQGYTFVKDLGSKQ